MTTWDFSGVPRAVVHEFRVQLDECIREHTAEHRRVWGVDESGAARGV